MLRGRAINIDRIASQNYNDLNFDLADLKNFKRNTNFDGISPPLKKLVKDNPLTQVQYIIKTAPMVVDSVSPTFSSNENLVINYGTPFEMIIAGRNRRFTATKVEMFGSGYTLNLPVLLEPLLIYVIKYVKNTDSGTYTIYTKSNEKISYGNGSFRSVTFNSNSKKNDYILLANINIEGYNSNWLVIGISENLSSFDFSFDT